MTPEEEKAIRSAAHTEIKEGERLGEGETRLSGDQSPAERAEKGDKLEHKGVLEGNLSRRLSLCSQGIRKNFRSPVVLDGFHREKKRDGALFA